MATPISIVTGHVVFVEWRQIPGSANVEPFTVPTIQAAVELKIDRVVGGKGEPGGKQEGNHGQVPGGKLPARRSHQACRCEEKSSFKYGPRTAQRRMAGAGD